MCPDSVRTSDTICAFPGCDRAVWQDPDGSFSEFCGKGHRDAMASKPGSGQMCTNCNVRPVYVQNGQKHDFCGIRCARAFKQQGNRPSASARAASISQSSENDVRCALTGCNKPVWVDRLGSKSDYCSNGHRRQAVDRGAEACLYCKEWPKAFVNGKPSDFCSATCGREAVDSAPAILELESTDTQFRNVTMQFRDQWKHPGEIPAVVKVWKIYNDKTINNAFERYKLEVERRTALEGGNSRRRWHGTVRACTLGDTSQDCLLCENNHCCLCLIIQSSFQLARSGQRFNFGRFGRGIYTSATSSKANDYIKQVASSPYSVMLLNDVIMGKAIKLTSNDATLTKPPGGYDSVVGEPGGDLNYDESIVYRNDAIRPIFLVIFKTPPPSLAVALSGAAQGGVVLRSPLAPY